MKIKAVLAILFSGIFCSAWAFACESLTIQKPTPFMGNHGEVFVLSDQSIWEVRHSYEYMYEYYPSVIVCSQESVLIIDGKKIDITRVAGGSPKTPSSSTRNSSSDYIESGVDGMWEGWDGDTIVRLTNGQIWEQRGSRLSISIKFNPDVTIFKKGFAYYMLIEGENKPVRVTRLN